MFGERLVRARKAAGLSMQALADEVGISANAIKKYEHGENLPSSANLLKIARTLNVRSEYFFRPVKVDLKGVEYRKHANTPQKLLNQINSDVLEQAERWKELLDLYPDSVKPVPDFSVPSGLPEKISSAEDIEELANQVRLSWSLGLNPISDMIDTLESQGVMIIVTDIESKKKFDGLAGTIDKTPIVVISVHQPGDRQRFTLAHELGHLVLKGRLPDDIDEEKACNHFAGAFLLPREALFQHLGNQRSAIEGRELFMLKHEFGISMMAVLMRAGQCGVISESLQKRYFMQFNKLGWRTKEPGDQYPNETTYLFKQLVYRALGEDYIGESKAAELLKMSLSSFHGERKLGMMSSAAIN
ncbi:MAG: ImmA/IrrE family metallo-endopeptidase [Methylophaga sp.]|nr:ImmA/IrrE family metallo-endopeptidase [Methylophaga sp.]